MRDEHDRLLLILEPVEHRKALLLEALVADCQDFVEQENVKRNLNRNRESEPHQHSRRVVLELLIDEALELRKLEDLVELRVELSFRKAGERRSDPNVLAGGETRVEADAELDEGREQS